MSKHKIIQDNILLAWKFYRKCSIILQILTPCIFMCLLHRSFDTENFKFNFSQSHQCFNICKTTTYHCNARDNKDVIFVFIRVFQTKSITMNINFVWLTIFLCGTMDWIWSDSFTSCSKSQHSHTVVGKFCQTMQICLQICCLLYFYIWC